MPIAAASIAQVHRARKGGKTYAVKVQFPNVRRQSTADVFTIDIITRIISKIFPEFKLAWLVREFEDNLPKELGMHTLCPTLFRYTKMEPYVNRFHA